MTPKQYGIPNAAPKKALACVDCGVKSGKKRCPKCRARRKELVGKVRSGELSPLAIAEYNRQRRERGVQRTLSALAELRGDVGPEAEFAPAPDAATVDASGDFDPDAYAASIDLTIRRGR